MVSKLTFTRLATSLGIKVVMTGLADKDALVNALSGKIGTTFKPKESNLKARQKWLASGSITLGSLLIDGGAELALQERKSLLTIGVSEVKGVFLAGEVVQLINEERNIVGVAKAKLDAGQMTENLAMKNILAAHADNIVLF